MAAMMDTATIRLARNADLAIYLLKRNEPLTKEGLRYRHKVHNSLIIKKNTYYWNSRQEHGNSVDFLMRYYGMGFKDAVLELSESNHTSCGYELKTQQVAIPPENDCKRAVAYLVKTRMIDYSIVAKLLNNRHLYQEANSNNILFPIYDESGSYVGAEVCGTLSSRRYKGVSAGSKRGYGFNVRFVDNCTFKYALFFESAIDLLSFIDLKSRFDKKTFAGCIMISMGGLKINVFQTMLDAFKTGGVSLKPVMCVDNDDAASRFMETLGSCGIECIDLRPNGSFKDYNDQLMAVKQPFHPYNNKIL